MNLENALPELMTAIAASPHPDDVWDEIVYARGDVDDVTQEAWLKAGAEQGIVTAMAEYADFLDMDDRLAEAEIWYRRAAAAGSAEAMYVCGLTEDERGNSSAAEAFYRSAAALGHGLALHDLMRILHSRDVRTFSTATGVAPTVDSSVLSSAYPSYRLWTRGDEN